MLSSYDHRSNSITFIQERISPQSLLTLDAGFAALATLSGSSPETLLVKGGLLVFIEHPFLSQNIQKRQTQGTRGRGRFPFLTLVFAESLLRNMDLTSSHHALLDLKKGILFRSSGSEKAMRPDLHHLLLSQVDGTKLKDLESYPWLEGRSAY